MDRERLNDLLYEALETERGGIEVYEAAIACAENEALRQEWEEYHQQTQEHERQTAKCRQLCRVFRDRVSPLEAVT